MRRLLVTKAGRLGAGVVAIVVVMAALNAVGMPHSSEVDQLSRYVAILPSNMSVPGSKVSSATQSAGKDGVAPRDALVPIQFYGPVLSFSGNPLILQAGPTKPVGTSQSPSMVPASNAKSPAREHRNISARKTAASSLTLKNGLSKVVTGNNGPPQQDPLSQSSSAASQQGPSVTTPSVTTPSVTTPSVTTPSVATPSVATPDIATPDIATPDIATPHVTLHLAEVTARPLPVISKRRPRGGKQSIARL